MIAFWLAPNSSSFSKPLVKAVSNFSPLAFFSIETANSLNVETLSNSACTSANSSSVSNSNEFNSSSPHSSSSSSIVSNSVPNSTFSLRNFWSAKIAFNLFSNASKVPEMA